jgi:hypothetical protein
MAEEVGCQFSSSAVTRAEMQLGFGWSSQICSQKVVLLSFANSWVLPQYCNSNHYNFVAIFKTTIDFPKVPFFERSTGQSRNYRACVEHSRIAKVYLVSMKKTDLYKAHFSRESPIFLEMPALFSKTLRLSRNYPLCLSDL